MATDNRTNRVERDSVTTYRAIAEVTTPIASRTFRSPNKYMQRRDVPTHEVRKDAGEWVQRLERMTGRKLQAGTVVRVRVEAETVRTITLTDRVTKTVEVVTPRPDRYGNQYWDEVSNE